MARSVLCLAEDQTLSDVANLMSSKDVDRFPVVREGKVVGFLDPGGPDPPPHPPDTSP